MHAKDETARKWYLNWEIEPSPSDPFHLFFLMKDIKATHGRPRRHVMTAFAARVNEFDNHYQELAK